MLECGYKFNKFYAVRIIPISYRIYPNDIDTITPIMCFDTERYMTRIYDALNESMKEVLVRKPNYSGVLMLMSAFPSHSRTTSMHTIDVENVSFTFIKNKGDLTFRFIDGIHSTRTDTLSDGRRSENKFILSNESEVLYVVIRNDNISGTVIWTPFLFRTYDDTFVYLADDVEACAALDLVKPYIISRLI